MQKKQLIELDEQTDIDEPLEYFSALFETMLTAVAAYQKMLFTLQIDPSALIIFESNTDYIEIQIKKRWDDFIKKGYDLPSDSEFGIQILSGMYRQICFWWIKNQEHLSKEEVIEKMSNVLKQYFLPHEKL